MSLEVEFWTLVTISVTFLGAIVGIVWGLLRTVLNQTMKRLDERDAEFMRRLDVIEKVGAQNTGQSARNERELLTLKAELPISYVRREDYVQSIAAIMTRLDAMALKFENILLKGGSPLWTKP